MKVVFNGKEYARIPFANNAKGEIGAINCVKSNNIIDRTKEPIHEEMIVHNTINTDLKHSTYLTSMLLS